jgi:NitT/TauT family transport system substrate-binding protein
MNTRLSSRRQFLKNGAALAMASPMLDLASNRSARAQGADVLKIGASPFINQAAIFLASDMGFFSKVGIDLKLQSIPDGSLVVAPLISGEIDVGVVTCSAGLFNSMNRGAPFRSILCNGQGSAGRAVTAIVVQSDAYEGGIRTLADLGKLKGQTVAVGAAGSINQYGLGTALQMAGLAPLTDVKWQTSVGQPDIVKQLGQKQLQAADLTYHLAYLAEKQNFCRIIASRDQFLPNSQTAMIAARDDVLSKRRDVLVRFAMAYIHAGRFFNKVAGDPAKYPEALQTIVKYIFVKDVEILKSVAPHWEFIAENGLPNVASVMTQQDFWSEPFKMVERKVEQAKLFDVSIATEAAARLDKEKPFGI